jgi:hypothetical protein
MKYLIVIFATLLSFNLQAKKVKFAVDMSSLDSGVYASNLGVHLGGTFQLLPGFSGVPFDASSLMMTQETADTNIYSLVLDIPAHQYYGFRFYNGDQGYDAEFVPEKSRVNIDEDYRWLYVDSVANDTTFMGAILFSRNAPKNKKLLRVAVSLSSNQIIDPAGVHVAGNVCTLNNGYSHTYSFDGTVYQNYFFVDSNGTYNYKYYNGNTSESVSGTCAIAGLRQVNVVTDTIIGRVCFGECDTNCSSSSGVRGISISHEMNVFPNPTSDKAFIIFPESVNNRMIYVYDERGSVVKVETVNNQRAASIDCSNLAEGTYQIVSVANSNNVSTHKLIIKK